MSGAPGLELFGQWDEGDAVRAAILKAGTPLGLKQVGYLAYPTTTLESGWIPGPLPAIFTGEALRPYRAWLPAASFEVARSLGGSYASDDITDYYATPYDLGYGSFVSLDHDFIGRKALETTSRAPRRRKVTLAWNGDDVSSAMHSLYVKGKAAQYIPLPWSSRYDSWHYDQVLDASHLVGLSTCCGYSYNERAMLSLAMVDTEVAIGSEVTLIWGDAVRRLATEPHVQVKIRAVIAPCPYAEVARTSYAPGWRTEAVRA
jgi:vanillate/3-O-methylgallate O-demethylase